MQIGTLGRADLHMIVSGRPDEVSRRPYALGMPAEVIDVATAAQMWRLGDLFIDVRTPAEYAHGHIAGALNVPINTLPAAERELPPGPVITACSAGGRGGRAATLLALVGRTAFTVSGGTKAWRAAGLPVVTGPNPGPRRAPRGFLRRY